MVVEKKIEEEYNKTMFFSMFNLVRTHTQSRKKKSN